MGGRGEDGARAGGSVTISSQVGLSKNEYLFLSFTALVWSLVVRN